MIMMNDYNDEWQWFIMVRIDDDDNDDDNDDNDNDDNYNNYDDDNDDYCNDW